MYKKQGEIERMKKNPTAVLIAALQPGKTFRQLYKMQSSVFFKNLKILKGTSFYYFLSKEI